MSTPLHFQSAEELGRQIKAKEVSSSDLLEHFLGRVEQYNPKLNAIIWMDIEGARARAKAADEALAKGEDWGTLHGVPMTIKESYQVAGSPTTWGRPDLKDNITDTTAMGVERLQAAGAVLFGKTNVPIHLADWQSYNEVYGVTNNPWDLGRTPGGSSGGSSAALAAGLTAIDGGSDIGGSIRNPAHYCGIFGHKPTYGVIPPRGMATPGVVAAADISSIGPLARSAADLEIALDAMAGPDLLDDVAWRLELPPAKQKSLKDFRVALKLGDPTCEIEAAYVDRLQELADKLAAAGATVSDTAQPDIDSERLMELYVLMLRAATSSRMSDEEFARWQAIMPTIDASDTAYYPRMVRGNTLSHRDWLRLNNERHAMRFKFAEFFESWDILLCPAAASAAFPHDHQGERHERVVTINNKTESVNDQLFWAGFAGVTYLPATVGPAGFVPGGEVGDLPVGYQAIAGHLQDKTAIQFARLVERAFGGFVPPAGYD